MRGTDSPSVRIRDPSPFPLLDGVAGLRDLKCAYTPDPDQGEPVTSTNLVFGFRSWLRPIARLVQRHRVQVRSSCPTTHSYTASLRAKDYASSAASLC